MAVDPIGSRDVQRLQQDTPCKIESFSDVAQQFDAVFLQSSLKSECIEQHFNTIPVVAERQDLNIPASRLDSIELVGAEIALDSPVLEQHQSYIPQSIDDFVKSVWPYVKQASNLIGIDPKVLMAQAALETGWGQFIAKDTDGSSSHNLFNIKAPKAFSDSAVDIKTTEFVDDTPMKVVASFKKYPSIQHSISDYISLITTNKRYQVALANAADPKRYLDELQAAGYATDPNYANKIVSIYKGDELQVALARYGYA